MKVTKNSNATSPGPVEWFTGAVYVDVVAAPSDGSVSRLFPLPNRCGPASRAR